MGCGGSETCRERSSQVLGFATCFLFGPLLSLLSSSLFSFLSSPFTPSFSPSRALFLLLALFFPFSRSLSMHCISLLFLVSSIIWFIAFCSIFCLSISMSLALSRYVLIINVGGLPRTLSGSQKVLRRPV